MNMNDKPTHRAFVPTRSGKQRYVFGWRVGNNGFLTVRGQALHIPQQVDIRAKGE